MVCTVHMADKESFKEIRIPESKKFVLVSIGNSMFCGDIWHKYH